MQLCIYIAIQCYIYSISFWALTRSEVNSKTSARCGRIPKPVLLQCSKLMTSDNFHCLVQKYQHDDMVIIVFHLHLSLLICGSYCTIKKPTHWNVFAYVCTNYFFFPVNVSFKYKRIWTKFTHPNLSAIFLAVWSVYMVQPKELGEVKIGPFAESLVISVRSYICIGISGEFLSTNWHRYQTKE